MNETKSERMGDNPELLQLTRVIANQALEYAEANGISAEDVLKAFLSTGLLWAGKLEMRTVSIVGAEHTLTVAPNE